MPRCLAAASIAAIALFAAAPDTRAASFDCSRAATRVETAICEDRALSALDNQMAQNYRALLNRTSGATESRIRSEQKTWLRQRNACGEDARCLNREYRARIQSIASWSGASASRETAAVKPAEEKPRTIVGGIFNRTARTAEPATAEPAEEKPGLLKRMITRVTPDFIRKDEEPEKTAPARRQQAQQEQPAPQQPLTIIGQRTVAKTAVRESEPVIATAEPAPRQKSVLRITSERQLAPPEPARQKSIPRQDLQPQVAAAEPARQKFVLRPATEQQADAPEPAPQLAARREPVSQGKWQDLDTGSGLTTRAPVLRTARTEPAREVDAPRRETARTKPEPVKEQARVETPALTYAPEDENEPPGQRILRQEPRVQMIKPLIVRDRPPAAEQSEPAIVDDESAALIDDAATAAIAPEVEPPAPQSIPELAALPDETPALPDETEATSSIPSPVKQALKSRFDTAYGSPNRIDLLSPLRQTRRFDPSRFDIFDEPTGG
jgi:uncharacterized protein YecT (DUF1311 family)